MSISNFNLRELRANLLFVNFIFCLVVYPTLKVLNLVPPLFFSVHGRGLGPGRVIISQSLNYLYIIAICSRVIKRGVVS